MSYDGPMKICTRCKVNQPNTSYYFKNKAKGWLHSQCKDCYAERRKEYYREHYSKYGDNYRKRARLRKKTIKTERQDRLYAYLQDKSCEHCGISDIRVLDLDHVNPSEKEFSITRAINDGYSWETILKEIKKCRILCANCHRIVTAKQFNWRKAEFR